MKEKTAVGNRVVNGHNYKLNGNRNSWRKRHIRLSFGDFIVTWINYFLLFLVALITLFPVLNVAMTSLYSPADMVLGASRVIHFPQNPTLSHYVFILRGNSLMINAMLVTISRTVVGTLLSLAVTMLTAYALSKKNLPGYKVLMLLFLFTMVFSAGMIPAFLNVQQLGLFNSFWALILPSLLSPFNMIIMRTFFRNMPAELEEAALIDGASHITVLTKIILPLSLPVIASISLFYAVWHWNSFFDAVIFITDRSLWPLQTLLREIVLSTSIDELQAGNILSETMPPAQTVVAASIMISTIPITLVYPFLQKHFAKGVMIGSVKG